MTEQNYAKKQAAAQYESICEMLAALDVDYDRLEELEDSESLCEDDIAELLRLREAAGDCTSQDDAGEQIQGDPLSVRVRSGWHDAGEETADEEFEILLCTGGPAVRIRGELDEHNEPDRAWLEYMDWGTPWQMYFDAEQDVLVRYSSQFYLGG